MEENKESNQNTINDSIIASTVSETFESWTLIPGASKNDEEQTTKSNTTEDEENKIEILKDKNVEGDNKPTRLQDKETGDDLSDGISIISDSESGGRESPQSLREIQFTNTINPLEFRLINENIPCELLTPPRTPQQEPDIYSISPTTDIVQQEQEQQEQNPFQIKTLFRRPGVSGFFILSTLIALIAFIAKLKCPEWQLTSEIDPLKQRVEDVELRNNLLRAEIDLLTKQINYITQENNKFKNRKSDKYNEKWSSEENKYEKNYKEKLSQNDGFSKTDEKKNFIPNTSNEYKEKSHENIETAGSLNGKKIQLEVDSKDSIKIEQQNQIKNNPLNEQQWDHKNSKRFDQKSYNEKKNSHYRKGEIYPPKYKENEHGHKHYEDKKYKKYNSGERYDDEFKKKDKFNNNYRRDSSKERYDNSHNKKYNSEESKEHFNGYKRKDNKNHYRNNNDWHEKMMENRENIRKKTGNYDPDNWYIELSSGREEARSSFKKDPKYKKN